MKKIIIPIALLLMLTSCNKPDFSPVDTLIISLETQTQEELRTDYSLSWESGTIPESASLSELNRSMPDIEDTYLDNNVPDRETDSIIKRIIQPGEDIGHFPLLAMIEEEDIYLYGINPEGAVLYQNGKGTYFNWPGLSQNFFLPQMMYHDFDGDTEKELAVLQLWGHGTSRFMMSLYILKSEEHPYGDWFDPIYTEYVLSGYDVQDWMTEPITVTVEEDGESFIVDICGISNTVRIQGWSSETQMKPTFAGVGFGDIVSFRFEGAQIKTSIAIGTKYEEFSTPDYFGHIQAYVVFDGENFCLENYTFTLY